MLSYVQRQIPRVVSGIVILMAVDLMQLIIPRVVQRTIDHLGASVFQQDFILRNTLFILALAFGMVILRFFWRIFIMGTSRRIERDVREDMFSHLQGLGFSFFNRTQTGDLMALMVNDVNAIRMATGLSFLALTDALFMGSLSLVFILSMNWRIGLLTITPLPLIIFMITRYGPMIQSRFKAVQESFASISSHTQEAFSGIRVIKGYVQEEDQVEKLDSVCSDYVARNMDLIKIWGFFFPAVTLFASMSMTILYLAGGRAVILQNMSFGGFVSFGMYLGLLIWPVIATGWVINLMQRGVASAKRILELMDEKSDVEDRSSSPHVADDGAYSGAARAMDNAGAGNRTGYGEIEIRNLTFGYGGKKVFSGISLIIPAGTSLGVMGGPGSGKTSLVSVLFRLFPVDPGMVFFDGCDINDIPLSVLRGSIGYVPQDPFLFSETVSENIGFGIDEELRDRTEIERYARVAAIYDEITDFSEGFDTVVGERGVTLSGGQKQRLCIARALFKNPDIIILDDALSSVDASTESVLLRNIRREMEGKTSIVVSHRVSTVMECDRIVVLRNGEIHEHGNHRELLREGGYYSRLYELQRLEEQVRD